jgi:glutaredoxin 3
MEEIKVYYLEGCPYCKKVEDKLEKMDLPFSKISVPSDHSKRDKVRKLSGQTSVPVINDPNNEIEGMNESSDIINYLESEYGNQDKSSSENPSLVRKFLSILGR